MLMDHFNRVSRLVAELSGEKFKLYSGIVVLRLSLGLDICDLLKGLG